MHTHKGAELRWCLSSYTVLVQEVTEFTAVCFMLHQSSTGKEVCIYLATVVSSWFSSVKVFFKGT